MSKLVYLCGPIAGMTYEDTRHGWREYVAGELGQASNFEIRCLSPMRAKDHLKNETVLSAMGYEEDVLSSNRGITARDRYDTQRSDLVFVNLLGATKVSIGSMIEFGWADSARRPLVVCMEPEGNPHDHAIASQLIDFRCSSLDEGIKVALAILREGV